MSLSGKEKLSAVLAIVISLTGVSCGENNKTVDNVPSWCNCHRVVEGDNFWNIRQELPEPPEDLDTFYIVYNPVTGLRYKGFGVIIRTDCICETNLPPEGISQSSSFQAVCQ